MSRRASVSLLKDEIGECFSRAIQIGRIGPLEESNVRMSESGQLPVWTQAMSTRCTQCCFDSGVDASVNVRHGAAARFAVTDLPVLQCEERVVPAQAHVLAWMNASPDLPHENRTGRNLLAPEDLHPTPLAVAIATVT